MGSFQASRLIVKVSSYLWSVSLLISKYLSHESMVIQKFIFQNALLWLMFPLIFYAY